MSHARSTIPRDVADVPLYVENFRAEHGFAPIAGGDTVIETPAIQVAPAPAPAPAPQAQPVAPAPAPAPQAAPQAQPAPPADWYDQLMARLPAPEPVAPDPLAVELGFVPAPQAVPQMQPPQTPASPGLPSQLQPQPGAPLPGMPMSQEQQLAQVQAWIDERVAAGVQAQVTPQLQAIREGTRQTEMQAVTSEYEEFKDPTRANELFSRARLWARQMGDENLVKDPLFVELSVQAARQMDATLQAQATQDPVPAVPAQGVWPPQPAGPLSPMQQQLLQLQQQQTVPIEQPGPAAPGTPVDPSQALAARIVAASGGNGLQGSVFA